MAGQPERGPVVLAEDDAKILVQAARDEERLAELARPA